MLSGSWGIDFNIGRIFVGVGQIPNPFFGIQHAVCKERANLLPVILQDDLYEQLDQGMQACSV